jgi:hypothetical protein
LELGIEYANIDEEERKMLREYMNPILQKNKTQIIEFKEMILNKEIALKESI